RGARPARRVGGDGRPGRSRRGLQAWRHPAARKAELMEFLVLFVLGGGFAALIAVARHQRADRRAAAATVSFAVDDWGVRRRLADGRYEEVGWDELLEVRAT